MCLGGTLTLLHILPDTIFDVSPTIVFIHDVYVSLSVAAWSPLLCL